MGCRAVVIVGDETSLQFGSRGGPRPIPKRGRSKLCLRGTTECYKESRLLAGSLTYSAVSTESQWAWRGARFVALSAPCGSHESHR